MRQVNLIGIEPDEFINAISEKVLTKLNERLEKKPNQYLSAKDVCDRFKVSKPTIHDWCKRGILKPRKLGARVYYRLDEIENAMRIKKY